MELNISNIQHFSVGDGEGIRTTVFFKGCNLRCPWCHNPENLSSKPVVVKSLALEKTEIVGRRVTVAEVLPELLEDRDFFLQSKGGVTLSGGEVMLQAEGAEALARALAPHGISVLIDTAGCVPYSEFQRLNPLVQGYLFDFKTAEEKRYEEIGGNLETVTQNLTGLIEEGISVRVRIPLIPRFNTEPKEIEAICRHLQGIGIREVDLLPFHRLASAKYEGLGLKYEYKDTLPLSKEQLDKIRKQYTSFFSVTIER